MALFNSIGELFGRSPIKPLQQHMQAVQECVEDLIPFFDTVIAEDWNQAIVHQQQIAFLESKADAIKKEIRTHLPKSLFLAMPRNDLLDLVKKQDKVANMAKDISGLMVGRQMKIPPEIATLMVNYVSKAIEVVKEANHGIKELDELIETGFGGREINLIEKIVQKLGDLETENDRQQIEIRAAVFAMEATLPPVDVIFLYKIIEWIGNLADRAQNVGDQIEVLLAR